MKLNFGPPPKTSSLQLDNWSFNMYQILNRMEEFVSTSGQVDHDTLKNTHNLTSDIDHDSLTNTHNLTTDIDHASITNLSYASAGHTGFQASIGYTPENVANKSTDVALGTSDTLYPSQKAVKSYVDTEVGGVTVDVATTVHAASPKDPPVDADETLLCDSAATYGIKKLTWAVIKSTLKAYFDGIYATSSDWTTDTDTWVYVSATSFKIVGKNVTGRFTIGCKLAWTQTSVYYGYAVAASMSGSDTLVTVAGNAVLSATITVAKYSYVSSPTAFPHWFDVTPVYSSGFSTAPSDGVCRFKIEGREVSFNLYPTTAGTSNADSTRINLPVTAKTLTGYGVVGPGFCHEGADYEPILGCYTVGSGGTYAQLWKEWPGTAWASSGDKDWRGVIRYEI